MADNLPRIEVSNEWSDWLTRLSGEEVLFFAAWGMLLFGGFCLYHVFKGLWTGSIWNPILPISDLIQMFDPPPNRHDRDTDGFNFWHGLIYLAVGGVLAIAMSMKMFGVW